MENEAEEQADEDHGGDRKIDSEMLLFDANVTREAAYPVKFMAEEVPDDSDEEHDCTCQDDDFSDLLVHCQYVWVPIQKYCLCLTIGRYHCRSVTLIELSNG